MSDTDRIEITADPGEGVNGPGDGDLRPLFKEALAIMGAKYESGHPEMRELLEEYAILLRQTGRGAEAADLEARARAIGTS